MYLALAMHVVNLVLVDLARFVPCILADLARIVPCILADLARIVPCILATKVCALHLGKACAKDPSGPSKACALHVLKVRGLCDLCLSAT